MHNIYDVIILGAGAAGLMCAQTAGNRGRSVLVLNNSNKAGKKILMSGGGRCNFTNLNTAPDDFICGNPHFVKSALKRYSPWHFLELVNAHSIGHEEKQAGQLFCSQGAKAILEMLLEECAQAGVQMQHNCLIEHIEATGQGFVLNSATHAYHCRSLVIATGGLSIPSLGSTSFGYQIASQFGHSIVPTRAGLVPFTLTDSRLKQLCSSLAGSSISNCRLSCGEHEFTGDLLFTHRGLSGPVVLQASSYWMQGQPIRLDLLNQPDNLDWLQEQQKSRPDSELKTLLGECFTRKIAQQLLEFLHIDSRPLKQYSPADLHSLAAQLGDWQLTPAGTEGYRTAEVTLGGVSTDEVSSKTMESGKQPGLYFIGEVLDVSGHLGGFNFQWAWASGHAAGSAV